ncbi:MAG: aminomethyl-transferring glycine dehydrogenase subunit GcvPB [Thermoplasmata archaeon]|uniref:glycine dehydrogenase (aminomethyl-transferring) n=1 Tax=Candidatus Sysuiplasma superficiale TaxID=2823368 RepID=A0A8J7YTJ7_9ARCH|nr:aminomethyl-transferring glycine dehydrogenase subunit GcvPB [Candidatus Sysuiplasma superficiale]MBX8644384.1 aminomethyl-transferring glycine dehydrogenase subunit GcvPB [Candidatus Sysuiplasma superficiale]
MTFSQAQWEEPLLVEIDSPAVFGFDRKVPHAEPLDKGRLNRKKICIPSVSERDLMRHYVNLSQMNFSVDNGPHLLGSCTMKYNPKLSETLASSSKVTRLHPLQPEETVQGSLRVMYELERLLAKISGMDEVSLQPAGGAQGEFAGMLITRAYFSSRGEKRRRVLVPDSAHGTNPASAAMAGFEVVELPSRDGMIDVDLLRSAVTDDVAALMLTNPNTLGLFEERVEEVASILHGRGALLYYDGANMNAIVGKTTPGLMGFDIVHFNLHKTFATPHGGGGPGAGPIGVKSFLARFLPVPRIVKDGDTYRFDYDRPESIGKLHSFYGNFGILLRAYIYILLNGGDGLRRNSEQAVLNANYLMRKISNAYEIPYKTLKKHEFVASASSLKSEKGITALDIAKRMMDYGVHPPTIYFPLIVPESLMIEPTENLSMQSLDMVASVFNRIAAEDEKILKESPHSTLRRRINEVKAARDMVFNWRELSDNGGVPR